MKKTCSDNSQARARRSALRPTGFSLVEVMAALLLMGLMLAALVMLLNNVDHQRRVLRERLAKRGALEHSLARMCEEIIMSGAAADVAVDQVSEGWQTSSHLNIVIKPREGSDDVARRVDWVSAPRPAYDDLVLFRREMQVSDEEEAAFVPMCDHLYSFDVQFITEYGEVPEDANEPAPVLEITAQMYKFGADDPENLITMQRTLCLKRF